MSMFSKSDGSKIQITFDQMLTLSSIQGNESHFTVTTNEYEFVPGGTLLTTTKLITDVAPRTLFNSSVNLSEGTITGLSVSRNILTLAGESNE